MAGKNNVIQAQIMEQQKIKENTSNINEHRHTQELLQF